MINNFPGLYFSFLFRVEIYVITPTFFLFIDLF